ncbi:hypothetical protein OIU79_010036 [Salix purpurea]|uniref:Uncharacterized protein n=1 Tax=Salix purpurea TaxID=77065 RepID=A0A9Q0QEM5_SALPP|nr:hypothetical protein OIU79_010036 [Salix purpurea]
MMLFSLMQSNMSSYPNPSFWNAVSFHEFEFLRMFRALMIAKAANAKEHTKSPRAKRSLNFPWT